MNLVQNRPAESGGVASAIALLIAYIAGVTDAGVIVALGVVVGFVPAAITWLVTTLRKPAPPASSSQSGYALVQVVLTILLAVLVYWVCAAVGLPLVIAVLAAVLVLLVGLGVA